LSEYSLIYDLLCTMYIHYTTKGYSQIGFIEERILKNRHLLIKTDEKEKDAKQSYSSLFIHVLKRKKLIEKKTTKLFDPIKRVQCKKSDKFFIITSSHLWFVDLLNKEKYFHIISNCHDLRHTHRYFNYRQHPTTYLHPEPFISIIPTYYLIECFFLFNDISLYIVRRILW
jgi:RNase P subunit RPR2